MPNIETKVNIQEDFIRNKYLTLIYTFSLVGLLS